MHNLKYLICISCASKKKLAKKNSVFIQLDTLNFLAIFATYLHNGILLNTDQRTISDRKLFRFWNFKIIRKNNMKRVAVFRLINGLYIIRFHFFEIN